MKLSQRSSRSFILYPKKNIKEVRQCVAENYGHIKWELPFLNALCVDIPESRISTMRKSRRIAKMSEDARVSKLPVESKPANAGRTINRKALESQGAGVSIAIIDTGVSPHKDLVSPYNRILGFKDFVNGRKIPYDDDGHGTHVAGIALGGGIISKQHAGTAPQAGLVSLKVLDQEGNGNASDILAAMQWIYDHHEEFSIKVVNLSFGVAATEEASIDPLSLGVSVLVNAGISVVTAAGNGGPTRGSITSPGTSHLAITVGSCNDDAEVPSFSSRGPTPAGRVKPDFLAPGVDVISLSSEDTRGYVAQTGTSMSAPFVSGIIADYYSLYPGASPAEIRELLMRSALPIRKVDRNTQGYGLLSKNMFSS